MKATDGQEGGTNPGPHRNRKKEPASKVPKEPVEEMVRRCAFEIASKLCVDEQDAKDIASEVRPTVLKHLARDTKLAANSEQLVSLIATCVQHRHLDMSKSRRRRRMAEPLVSLHIERNASKEEDTETVVDRWDLREAIDKALGGMPAVRARVLRMFYLEELPLRRVAGVLGIAVNTAKRHLTLGKPDLRRRLKDYAPPGYETTGAFNSATQTTTSLTRGENIT